MVQKIVNVESKASLKSSTMVRNLDICCPKGHRSSNSTASKLQTQGTTAKKPRPKEFRSKEMKLAKEKSKD